eukprot:1196078-Prorocentrum_minimum.AAC.11
MEGRGVLGNTADRRAAGVDVDISGQLDLCSAYGRKPLDVALSSALGSPVEQEGVEGSPSTTRLCSKAHQDWLIQSNMCSILFQPQDALSIT